MEGRYAVKYDFDTPVDRRGTDSIKWDVKDGELPMWVADMDFVTAPSIIDAMRERLEHGIFGYSGIPDDWYRAYIQWWKQRHGFEMDKEWLIFCTGVIPAISSAVRKLTTPNENVVIQTPVYNVFFNCILNNGCRVLENPLRYAEDHTYSIDFEDLEKKLSDPQTTLMILCNPHNPTGRIWSREELSRIGDLAYKHHVTVISDEIHCDITIPGKSYIPFASVSENCRKVSITCISPTKCFNIAGIKTAAVSVPDPVLRHKMWRALNTDEVAEPNTFAVVAAVAAFDKGGEWLDALCSYIAQNRQLVSDYVAREIPGVHVVQGEATYLLWIDVSLVPGSSKQIAKTIREKTGLFITAGSIYGQSGDHFLRMNIACPRQVVSDGMTRLRQGILQCLQD